MLFPAYFNRWGSGNWGGGLAALMHLVKVQRSLNLGLCTTVFWRSLNPHLFPFQESGVSGSWPSWHVHIWLTFADPRFGCHIVCFQNKDLHYTLGPRPLWHLHEKWYLIKQFKICNSAQPLFSLFCVLGTKRRALPFLKEYQPSLREPLRCLAFLLLLRLQSGW